MSAEAVTRATKAEARVRELEERNRVLEHDLDAQIAGHRLSANEATKHLMRVHNLEVENRRLTERLDLLAVGFGVPDGGRYIADWQTKIDRFKAVDRIEAETIERCAEVADCHADECDAASFSSTVAEQVSALRSKEQAAHEIAAAIRQLAKEVKP